MKNKFFYFFLFLFFLTSCGYKPIYSSKNLNFSIGNINKNNTSLNNKFAKSISALVNNETNKKMDINIDSNKTIKIKSKDPKGNALVFELKIYLRFSTLIMNNKTEKLFSSKITYNNSEDKFRLRQYENELENILITKIVEDLINYLSNM